LTHVINEETGESSIIIGKASEVVEELQEGPSKEEEWRERLDKIDQRQERIEKMLERLVGDKYADVFSADDGDGA
jgi:predicted nuclease with TOPRIM domain